jgi:hypothetical protein
MLCVKKGTLQEGCVNIIYLTQNKNNFIEGELLIILKF